MTKERSGVRVGCWPVFCYACHATWSTGWSKGDHSTCPSCGGNLVRHAKKVNETGETKAYFKALGKKPR